MVHKLNIQFKDQHQNFKSESGVWHWRPKSCLVIDLHQTIDEGVDCARQLAEHSWKILLCRVTRQINQIIGDEKNSFKHNQNTQNGLQDFVPYNNFTSLDSRPRFSTPWSLRSYNFLYPLPPDYVKHFHNCFKILSIRRKVTRMVSE